MRVGVGEPETGEDENCHSCSKLLQIDLDLISAFNGFGLGCGGDEGGSIMSESSNGSGWPRRGVGVEDT